MTTDRINRALEIFRDACERTPAEQAAYLDEACADDAAMRVQVESMLAFDTDEDDKAPSAVRNVLSDLADAAEVEQSSPPVISGYRVVRLIAHGGMGDVYEAEQDHPQRRVAIKVARVSGTTTERARRFELETQLLARLQHPRIAQIIEAGTTDTEHGARPFFVMEFVEGQRLDDYADSGLESAREKLELMAAVCEAIGFAHQRGVVHRDLKPDNVLIEPGGKPKVLDFGVAKVEDAGGFGAATLRTEAGRVIGTLGYMAPEQLGGRTEGLGPEADVYSLGVMIYELLSGRLPHELDAVTLSRALAVVTTTDAPLLGTVRPEYRGDIEAVVAKALEKDPRHRYPDAAALKADIDRFVRGEPTVARPAGPMLKFTRWAQRNRALAASVCALFVALAAAPTILWVKNVEIGQVLAEYEQLEDAAVIDQAVEQAGMLGPTRLAELPQIDSWMQRFGPLAERLRQHEATLADIRSRGELDDSGRWSFGEDYGLKVRHDVLARLVTRLTAFTSDKGLFVRMLRRRELARSIDAETIDACAQKWADAIDRIRNGDRYPGLKGMTPMVGYVPLGPDPASGLEEFLHFETHDGAVPQRDAEGRLPELTSKTGLILVLIPGGRFVMGAHRNPEDVDNYDPNADDVECPPHEVSVTAFLLSKYEMTAGQWARIAGKNPSQIASGRPPADNERFLRRPVQSVSRARCSQMMRRLDLMLPTEAQWEYATRAGSTTVWPFFDCSKPGDPGFEGLARFANLAGRETSEIRALPGHDEHHEDRHPMVAHVGQYEPNRWGLHDVIGNVFEWCADNEYSYSEGGEGGDDGDVPHLGGNGAAMRGGTFVRNSVDARSAFRGFDTTGGGHWFVGLRPAARVITGS